MNHTRFYIIRSLVPVTSSVVKLHKSDIPAAVVSFVNPLEILNMIFIVVHTNCIYVAA